MYNVIHKVDGKEKVLFDVNDEQNDLTPIQKILIAFANCGVDEKIDFEQILKGNKKPSYKLSKEETLLAQKMQESIVKGISENLKIVICTSKKYVSFGSEKIQCHEKDKFDWKIGLGLAISHSTNSKFKKEAKININDYRYKVIEKDSKGKILNTYKEFDYKEYANKILKKYFALGHKNYDFFVKTVNLALEKKENICFSLAKWEEDLKRIIKKEEK